MTRVDAVIANLRRLGALGLADRVAHKYRVPRECMLGDDLHRSPIAARHELWTLLRHTLDLSLLELECLFQRDHSTILQAIRKCERKLEAQHAKESA